MRALKRRVIKYTSGDFIEACSEFLSHKTRVFMSVLRGVYLANFMAKIAEFIIANATLSELNQDCKTAKNRCEIGKLMLPISKQEKGCMSVNRLHPCHICRQNRQRKRFSHFRLAQKVYVGKNRLW